MEDGSEKMPLEDLSRRPQAKDRNFAYSRNKRNGGASSPRLKREFQMERAHE